MNDAQTTIAQLKQRVQQFCSERDWDQFHTPQNLILCMLEELGEIGAHFRHCTTEESTQELEKNRTAVEHEIADLFILMLRFCQYYQIDLSRAFAEKLALIEKKYPVEECKGKRDKYTAYSSRTN